MKPMCISVLVFTLSFAPITYAQQIGSVESDALQEILSKPLDSAGRTDFNAVDRFAIYNIVSAYSMTYDEHKIEAYSDLFWPEAVFTVKMPGSDETSMSINEWIRTITERFKDFKKKGFQRRHIFGKIFFLEQTEKSIHTVHNALLINVINQKETKIVLSVLYEGWFEKRNGIWKIVKWRPVSDASLDVSLQLER